MLKDGMSKDVTYARNTESGCNSFEIQTIKYHSRMHWYLVKTCTTIPKIQTSTSVAGRIFERGAADPKLVSLKVVYRSLLQFVISVTWQFYKLEITLTYCVACNTIRESYTIRKSNVKHVKLRGA